MARSKRSPQPSNGMPYEPDLRRAKDLVMQLMAIPGRSGNERRVAEFIRKKLLDAGASPGAIESDSVHLRTPMRGDTGNLVFKLSGTRRADRRMLSAHMDTVPLCVGCKPVVCGRFVQSAVPGTALGGDDRSGVAV
ncbi:MAG: hypothetical protein ACYS0H_24065, partial [Planctomycetota bacterium]